MVHRHFKDQRARKIGAPKFNYGLSTNIHVAQHLSIPDEEFKYEWADIEKVWCFLWRDERIILNLMREGKTVRDISEIMRLPKWQDERIMLRAIRVVQFFLKWYDELMDLKSGKGTEQFSAKQVRVARLYAYHRMEYTKIAGKVGYTPDTVQSVLRRISLGDSKFAEMIKECLSNMSLTNCNYKNRRAAMSEPWRAELKNLLLDKVTTVWYQWGAQTPLRDNVADCSGLVIRMLQAVKVLPEKFRDRNAQGLSKYFGTMVKNPQVGDLAFYGANSNSVVHVMFYLGEICFPAPSLKITKTWSHAVIGMCGGKKDMSLEWAQLVGAGLWVKQSVRYRKDFLFFRRVK